jgi:hypothetical protein
MNGQKESGSEFSSSLPLTPFRRRYWATFLEGAGFSIYFYVATGI